MTLKNDTQDSSVLVSLLQYRIDRKGLSTWPNKKDRQQSMQESTFNFSNILYSSFLRIRRCRLRSRFLGCITAGRLATSFPAKVPPISSSSITPSLIYSFNHLRAVFSAACVFIFCSWRMVCEKYSVASPVFNNSLSLL